MKKLITIFFLFSLILLAHHVEAQLTFGGTRTNLVVAGSKGFIIEPPVEAENGRKPWVWYAPTIGIYPNKSNFWLLESLVKQGFYVCGIDVGESFGNPEGRKIYSAFYDTIVSRYLLDKKVCLIPQSRGGLMLYNWAAEPRNSQKVARIAGIYPVCDLLSYPGLDKAAAAYHLSPDSLTAHLAEHNPIDRLLPLYKAGIPIFHIHGDNDIIVPLFKNSMVIYNRYKAMGGNAILKIIPGKGHMEIPEYFQSQELLDFILQELKAKK